MYYKMGARLITLTWNYANELADGITGSRGGGLTAFGREAVSMMESMGILIDVSHLSERGFWDGLNVLLIRLLHHIPVPSRSVEIYEI